MDKFVQVWSHKYAWYNYSNVANNGTCCFTHYSIANMCMAMVSMDTALHAYNRVKHIKLLNF